MKILCLLVAATGLLAETPILVDLSGEWRVALDDHAGYRSPDFNDRSWQSYTLPAGNRFHYGINYWLRCQFDLPPGAQQRPLALTLGALQGAYEVYVNGQRLGATSSTDSFADASIPRPVTFDLPPGASAPQVRKPSPYGSAAGSSSIRICACSTWALMC